MKQVGQILRKWNNGWLYVVLPLTFLGFVAAVCGAVAAPFWFASSVVLNLQGQPDAPILPFWAASLFLLAPFFARQGWPAIFSKVPD